MSMMDLSTQKEQFSIAYIQALAAQAGLTHAVPVVDNDSIDISILGRGFNGRIRSPQINVQLKCTSNGMFEEECLKFDLKLKNYEDLSGEGCLVPRYLVVLVVPDKPEDWIIYSDEGLLLKYCCYWTSLRFDPVTANSKSVRVEVPIDQRVTASSLINLMEIASEGKFV
jgi:hypothetical protein